MIKICHEKLLHCWYEKNVPQLPTISLITLQQNRYLKLKHFKKAMPKNFDFSQERIKLALYCMHTQYLILKLITILSHCTVLNIWNLLFWNYNKNFDFAVK